MHLTQEPTACAGSVSQQGEASGLHLNVPCLYTGAVLQPEACEG